MKLNVEKSALAELLAKVAPAAKSDEYPVKLVAGDGRLKVTASNKEITVSASSPAEVSDDGTVVVSFKALRERVVALPDGPVELSVDGAILGLRSGRSRFRIGTDVRGDFPTVELPEGEATVFDGQSLLAAVRQVAPSASSDVNRPVFTGVYFDPSKEGEGLRLVATDTLRLAVHDLPGEGLSDTAALVPALALTALARCMGGATEIAVRIDERSVAFSAADAVLVTRLIAGEYPDYPRLLEVEPKTTWTVGRKELLDSLKRAEVVLKSATHMKVKVDIAASGVKVSAAQGAEDFVDEVTTASLDGEDVSFFINPAMLRGGIEVVDGDDVTLSIAAPNKVILVTCSTDASFQYAVMPVRG